MRLVLILHLVVAVFLPPRAMAEAPVCSDAVILAVELTGELLAPPAYVQVIDLHLADIRTAYPEVIGIGAEPDAPLGALFVKLTEAAWIEWKAGTLVELDSLNVSWGVNSIREYNSLELLYFEFADCYNPEPLSEEYESIDGVLYAEPAFSYGDGPDIDITSLGSYTFRRGYGDCTSGCINEYIWKFEVANGIVTLVDYIFTSVPNATNLAGLTLEQNSPNPFNPTTTLRFGLVESGYVELRVVDVMGRAVRILEKGFRDAGSFVSQWDGRTSGGDLAASGVYFAVLSQGDQAVTRKMVLVE